MTKNFFLLLLLSVPTILAPSQTAWANRDGVNPCPENFALVGKGGKKRAVAQADPAVPGQENGKPKRRRNWLKPRSREFILGNPQEVKVAEVFPKTVEFDGEARIRAGLEEAALYKAHFDALMEKWIEEGSMTPKVLREWRSHLTKGVNVNEALAGYPAIDGKRLYEHYVQKGRTLDSYYDGEFMKFVLEKTKGLSFESRKAYIDSLPKKRIEKSKQWIKAQAREFGAATRVALAVSFFSISGQLVPLVKSAVNAVTGFGYNVLNEKAIEPTLDKVWLALELGLDKEKAKEDRDKLREHLNLFRNTDYSFIAQGEREQAQKNFDNLRRYYLQRTLAKYRPVVEVVEKNFDQTHLESVMAFSARLSSIEVTRSTNETRLKVLEDGIRDGKSTDTEKDQAEIEELKKQLAASETELASGLARWLHYKMTFKDETIIPKAGKGPSPEEDQILQNAYERYMRTMKIDKLKIELSNRVEEYLGFMDKAL
jgi:hypothetical protein